MTREERHRKIVEKIVDFGEIFETFALNGRPIFSDMVPTACVCFNTEGNCIGFVWGKDFFDSCSDYTARFILCHEMLHIFLKHGVRGHGLENKWKLNVAMDLSINHLLIDEFGFIRGKLDNWETLCWRDKVFNKFVPALSTFEGYYAIDDSFFNKGFKSIDDHNFQFNEDDLDDETKRVLDKLRKKMARDFPSQGDEVGHIESEFTVEKIKKPKFETLVKKITASAIEKKKKLSSSWTTLDRRLCEVAPDIPTTNKNHERICRAKWKCAFFIDNSGSCEDYAERFCRVAGSLDLKVFDVDVFSFDTGVHKIEINDGKYRVTGGGGTCFNCIGKKVDEINPDLVFVVTDGEANTFAPVNKKKYFWFLTENGTEVSIRNAGKRFRLSQFE
jgi:predicted metal-dependent peptidase